MSFPQLDLRYFIDNQGSGFLAENAQNHEIRPALGGIYIDSNGNINNIGTEKTKTYKTDQNRRARNVISSRKYRAKKKEQVRQLNGDNQRLQAAIDVAESQLEQLNQCFRMFIQHAEICSHCCNVELNFAER